MDMFHSVPEFRGHGVASHVQSLVSEVNYLWTYAPGPAQRVPNFQESAVTGKHAGLHGWGGARMGWKLLVLLNKFINAQHYTTMPQNRETADA